MEKGARGSDSASPGECGRSDRRGKHHVARETKYGKIKSQLRAIAVGLMGGFLGCRV